MPAAPRQRSAPAMRGYLKGVRAAATYCGVDRKTFRSWRDDPTLGNRELPDAAHHPRRLLLSYSELG